MSAGRHAGLFDQPHGAEQVREQQPVDHEAGDVGDLDGRLLEGLAQRERARAGLLARLAREHELDELHLRDGVEDVQARRSARGARSPRPGAATDSEEVVLARIASGPTIASSSPSSRGLDVVVLDDRLDDERRLGERLRVGHDLDVLGVDLGAEARERLLDGRPGAVGRLSERASSSTGP